MQAPAEGATTFTEEQSRQNFDATRRFVVPREPEASRLLMHPLARSAGGDPFHGGGKHWQSKEDAEWQALARWVNRSKATAEARIKRIRPSKQSQFARIVARETIGKAELCRKLSGPGGYSE